MLSDKEARLAHRAEQYPDQDTAALDDLFKRRGQALELVGEVGAPLRQPLREGVVLQVEGMGQMVDPGQHRAEELPVVHHAADRDAAEADAVVGECRGLVDQLKIGGLAIVAHLGARLIVRHHIDHQLAFAAEVQDSLPSSVTGQRQPAVVSA